MMEPLLVRFVVRLVNHAQGVDDRRTGPAATARSARGSQCVHAVSGCGPDQPVPVGDLVSACVAIAARKRR
jgi:hypothetical protein